MISGKVWPDEEIWLTSSIPFHLMVISVAATIVLVTARLIRVCSSGNTASLTVLVVM